jgi:hypothetical protein
MIDEPKAPSTKIGPQLIGIVAAAAVLVAAMRTERLPDDAGSPLQRAANNLRIDMTSAEARVAMQIPVGLSPPVLDGGLNLLNVGYYDPQRSEWLWLSFREDGDLKRHRYHDRLIKWDLHR